MTQEPASRSDDADTVAVPRAFLRELFIEDWGLWHSSPQGHCKRCKATWINGGKEKHKDGCLLAAPRSERGALPFKTPLRIVGGNGTVEDAEGKEVGLGVLVRLVNASAERPD